MKTQKTITQEIAAYFKKSYAYTMGGSQTLIFPNGEKFTFNDKEYYSGRGSKYNASIRHDNKGEIQITKKEVAAYFKILSDRKKLAKQRIVAEKLAAKRYEENAKNGVYGIGADGYIELSAMEQNNCVFKVDRLAKTLGISEADAKLVASYGKTYVFAKDNQGQTIMIYHPSLSCNDLSINVSYPTEDYVNEFMASRPSWVNAPYAKEVGQSDSQNHFVC